MGVSVRLSRNTRAYVPFWLAVPGFALVAAVWLVAVVVWLVVLLFVVLPARVIRSRQNR